ncbi:hypothetical protein EG68_11818 [Paragonimus skrjabini miyazakii]|uniref:Uncharacterized protein n=1 Tax=Paragonimus skrjabini miyazakii TaxID=59628 RepID=A0A8S9Y847_9TREM|nr:hypothetical protein EG68_11818 [Paragonimus skrjabini miyazakii]
MPVEMKNEPVLEGEKNQKLNNGMYFHGSVCPPGWSPLVSEGSTKCFPDGSTSAASAIQLVARAQTMSVPTTRTWQHPDNLGEMLELKNIVENLKPHGTYLQAQQDAMDLVQNLYYLGFGNEEILLMLTISIGLALVGLTLTTTIFFGLTKPMQWKRKDTAWLHENRLQRLLPFIPKIVYPCARIPVTLFSALHRCLANEATYFGESFKNSKVGKLVRETLNIYRRQIVLERLEDLRRTELLKELLAQLTVDRIVETAKLAQERYTVGQPTLFPFDGRIKVKRKTTAVLQPYLRLPSHYDAAFFLLHPLFWKRSHLLQIKHPAPLYSLKLPDRPLNLKMKENGINDPGV